MCHLHKSFDIKSQIVEHTKKTHINLLFYGPKDRKNLAVKLLQAIEFELIDAGDHHAIPSDNVLAEFSDNVPGVCLKAAREKEKLTQKQLSERVGIPQRHISEMETGKRTIGKKNAKAFSKALNVGYKFFL
jgi:ribosome-binding protein aMBF1 (putative translation factor)